MKGWISKGEYLFLKEKLLTRDIPTPLLLVKGHKKKNEFGEFPTRIVVPATNFTAGFAKLGYLGIKKIFIKKEIKCFSKTIVQASNLKDKLEKTNVKKEETMIATLDIKDMYPSIKFKVIQRAVEFDAQDLEREDKERIEQCLQMIKFSIRNQLFGFLDKFYTYYGQTNNGEEQTLTIGGYKSAWLADLVASFILDNCENYFNLCLYHGIYRYDGLVLFKGKWSDKELVSWLNNLQKKTNKTCETNKIIFTLNIWSPNFDNKPANTSITNVILKIKCKNFPYLDMIISWDNETDDLQFKIHLKPNQCLKYFNVGNKHPHLFSSNTMVRVLQIM